MAMGLKKLDRMIPLAEGGKSLAIYLRLDTTTHRCKKNVPEKNKTLKNVKKRDKN